MRLGSRRFWRCQVPFIPALALPEPLAAIYCPQEATPSSRVLKVSARPDPILLPQAKAVDKSQGVRSRPEGCPS